MTTKDDEKKEGPRGFAVVLQQIDEGALHGELSERLQALTKEIAEHVASSGNDARGSLTLTVSLAGRRNGTIEVTGDVKIKTPKVRRGGSVFWPTKSGNLSTENPRQGRLPLREVPGGAAQPRDVDADGRPARTV